jgi:hypothetical protein
MMKSIIFCCCVFLITACGVFNTLSSTTEIGPKNSFILGEGQHGNYNVDLRNISQHVLQLRLTPLEGNPQPLIGVNPKEKVSLKVEKNTKLEVVNPADSQAKVELLVTGDTKLSMGYKN